MLLERTLSDWIREQHCSIDQNLGFSFSVSSSNEVNHEGNTDYYSYHPANCKSNLFV